VKPKTDCDSGETHAVFTKDEERKVFAVADLCEQAAWIERFVGGGADIDDDIRNLSQRLIDLVMNRRQSAEESIAPSIDK